MDPSAEDSAAGSNGPPDRQALYLLERQLASDPLVAEIQFDPDPYEPRFLPALFDTGRYLNSVTAALLKSYPSNKSSPETAGR